MAFSLFITIILIGSAIGQSTVRPQSTAPTTPTSWIDPFSTGKYGNPGARGMVCKKSLDGVHEFVSDTMSAALLAMSVADLNVNFPGFGTLIVKPPRVTEASFAKYDYSMLPPKSIRTRLYDGHLVASGVWQFKPAMSDTIGGTYRAVVQGTELNATNMFERTPDAKPRLNTQHCKANITNFRVEVQGHNQIKFVENCELPACVTIREYFERAICQLFEAFVKEVVNRELQLIPNRMCINGDQYRVDYGLLLNEPTVNDTTNCIQAGMEGKYIWRGSFGVPFQPTIMEWDQREEAMYSFHLSDYTFNTLFHQAHYGGYRFAAADLPSQAIKDLLRLNCDDTEPTTSTPKPTTSNPSRKYRGPSASRPKKASSSVSRSTRSGNCLGSLFSNVSNFGPYSASDLGDIVFKTSRPNAIYLGEDKGFFDGCNGALEFYGPAGQGGNRQLLARADVRLMRGEFTPKLNGANITASIKITSLELSQASYLRMSSEWLENAASFSMPIVTETINAFLEQYAQFPVPLPAKYECASPTMIVHSRTVQLDCEVKPATNADEHTPCRCFRDTCVCPSKSGDP